jgi:branched-chain amino acid transport system permease protein
MYVQSVVTLGAINVVMVLGLTILTGYTGLFSMGNMGFMMIGAYISAIVYRNMGVPFYLALVCGGLAAMLASLFIGFPAVRGKLKGDHFAIAMLGFASAVKVIISNTRNKIVNGALGIKNIPKLTNMWVALGIVAILTYLLAGYVRSAYGRNCRAVREEEMAAEIMGVRVSRVKLTSVLICAFCTGVGGGLFAFYMTLIAPTMFTQNQSDNHLIAVVFGGINSITGPIISAFVLNILPEALRVIGEWRLVIYGVLVVVIMLFKPEGLFGYTEITDIARFFTGRIGRKDK